MQYTFRLFFYKEFPRFCLLFCGVLMRGSSCNFQIVTVKVFSFVVTRDGEKCAKVGRDACVRVEVCGSGNDVAISCRVGGSALLLLLGEKDVFSLSSVEQGQRTKTLDFCLRRQLMMVYLGPLCLRKRSDKFTDLLKFFLIPPPSLP